jgi:orotate phosphoribosyltransferase
MIIQDVETTGTSVVEFLRKSRKRWCAREQIGPIVTLVDSMFIKKSKEDKTMEQHFVEA